MNPDLELARRFLSAEPPPGPLLLCAVTGSHQYGFPSPDSDLDLKGIHVAPAKARLGLDEPQETFDRTGMCEGTEFDLTTHEARKALNLLYRGNGNMLERIFSPFQLFQSDDLGRLRKLARPVIARHFVHHYRGFFTGMCQEFDRAAAKHAKPMLYSYRVALTGVHLLRTGLLEADLETLAPRYGFDSVQELIDKKRATAELVPLGEAEAKEHRARWPELDRALTQALAESPLPEEPGGREELSVWLAELRTRPIHQA